MSTFAEPTATCPPSSICGRGSPSLNPPRSPLSPPDSPASSPSSPRSPGSTASPCHSYLWPLGDHLVASLRHRRHLGDHRAQLPRHPQSRRLPALLHLAQRRAHPRHRRLLLCIDERQRAELPHILPRRTRRLRRIHDRPHRRTVGLRWLERPHHGRRRSPPPRAQPAHRADIRPLHRRRLIHGD